MITQDIPSVLLKKRFAHCLVVENKCFNYELEVIEKVPSEQCKKK
jgi:hypothetical protein